MVELSFETEGGIGDGNTDNTQAFRHAFEEIETHGGGVLTIPPGIWLTGPIAMPGNCTLRIQKEARISFIPEFDRYRPVWTRWEGVDCYAMHPCILAREARKVVIEGEGIIDGRGSAWWRYRRHLKEDPNRGPVSELERALAKLNPGYQDQPGGGGGRNTQFLAPPTIQFHRCIGCRLEGVTITDSPFWTVHPVYCSDVEIRNIRIRNPYDAPNTDGIDIDSCNNVFISGCSIDVGDDAIALKSGSGEDGLAVAIPTAHVTVSGCVVERAHGGIVVGSETAGGIRDVAVFDCRFIGTDRGIRIKTRRGRGGEIRDLSFERTTMIGNLCPIAINMYYKCGVPEHERVRVFSLDHQKIVSSTPSISGIRIAGLHAMGCKASAGFFIGLPESPIEGLHLVDCRVETDTGSEIPTEESEMYEGPPPVATRGMRFRHCRNLRLDAVTVTGSREPISFESDVELA